MTACGGRPKYTTRHAAETMARRAESDSSCTTAARVVAHGDHWHVRTTVVLSQMRIPAVEDLAVKLGAHEIHR